MDAGQILEEALRALPDIRQLILPLGFQGLDVRAFRSGAVSGVGGEGDRVSSTQKAGAGGVEMSHVAERSRSTARPPS